MNALGWDLLALLVWPGLISAALLGWLYMWMVRKLTARLQGRQGPPFYQPFFDFVKLLGKETIVPAGINHTLFYALPLVSLVSVTFAIALVPIPGNPLRSVTGDLIVFLYLLEMPALCEILAGFVTRSPYGQVGASREAMMSLAYNLPFLAAVIALAVRADSFSMAALTSGSFSLARLIAALALFLALPARIKSNPFSIPNAEQELAAGARTEYNGLPLALFELSHAFELVAMINLLAAIFLAPLAGGPLAWVVYVVLSLVVLVGVTVLATATARLKLNQAFRFYWSWGAAAAFLALLVAVIG